LASNSNIVPQMPDSLELQTTASQPSPRWKPEKDEPSAIQDVPDGMNAELDEQREPLDTPPPANDECDSSREVAITDEQPAEKDFEFAEPPLQHAASSQSSHGIFWRSPVLMIAGFLAGSLACFGHHRFYLHFDGTIVGSANDQEWNIRYDSFCLKIPLHS
jgi:hypothetical protein